EWVRQHFLNLLINHLHYPKGLMNVESGLTYFKKTKRSDITINQRNQSVFMLIECKSPQVKIDKKTLNQISQYNKKIAAKFICVTNGIKHFIWEYDLEKQAYLQQNSFPKYPEN
ncbi:MAG: type I restriction enzyme HsdR N-terminal domain-containing protein, partial [Cyclobacteriaceae bacterium]